jgi:hypothetical protein
VALDAGSGALGRLLHALATIAVTKVDDHGPLANSAVRGLSDLALRSREAAADRGPNRRQDGQGSEAYGAKAD